MLERSTFFISQRQARWTWPWLLLSIPAGVLVGVLGGGVAIFALYVFEAIGFGWAEPARDFMLADEAEIARTPVLVLVELASVGLLLWPAAIAGTLVHGRSVKSLISPLQPFRWSIVRKCLTVQVGLIIIGVLVTLPWDDGNTRFTGVGLEHLIWLLPVVLGTLLQTSSEDVFFKGFLLRQVGAVISVWWLAPLVITAIFVSLHVGNPDVRELLWLILPYFVISEIFIIYLVMRTGGMEAALATHWLNNFFIFWFLSEAATQSNELTLFVFDEDPTTSMDEALGVGIALVAIAIQFAAFVSKRSPFYLEPHGWEPVPEPATSPPPQSTIPTSPQVPAGPPPPAI